MVHILITWSSSLIILLLGMFLMTFKTPDNERWIYLRLVKVFLAISFTTIAIAGLCLSIYEMEHGAPSDRRMFVLSSSFIQTMLFTGTAITFIQPPYLTKKNFGTHLAAILTVIIIILTTTSINEDLYLPMLWFGISAYVIQIMHCTILFITEYKKGKKRLEAHYDDEYGYRLRWIRMFFSSALAIGIIALVYSIVPADQNWFDLFIIIQTVFYIYVIRFIMIYMKKGRFIVNAIPIDEEEEKSEKGAVLEMGEGEKQKEIPYMTPHNEAMLTQALKEWVKNDGFLMKDKSIDEIADLLGTTHDMLNSYCMAHYNILFRTWRMKLRIEKAKKILEMDPAIKITDLQTRAGFADKSHFLRQFKQITGSTPSEYKKSLLKKEE